MKSYPYIGKGSRSGAVFLFLSEGDGLVLEQGFSSFTGRKNNIVETLCRNITAEYLANTYGEVKSKEHAEFIVKLAETAKGKNFTAINLGEAKSFVFDSEGDLKFYKSNVNDIVDSNLKQITIPLPPECEVKTPKEVMARGRIYKLRDHGLYESNHNQLGYIEWESLKALMNAPDYKVITFIDDEVGIGLDKFPQIGDKALVVNNEGYELSYGEELIGKEVEVTALFEDGDLSMAVVKHDVANYCFRIEMLSKPKTKEEKEREEIKEDIKEIFREAMKSPFWFIYDSDEQAANYLLERFDITKKPQ